MNSSSSRALAAFTGAASLVCLVLWLAIVTQPSALFASYTTGWVFGICGILLFLGTIALVISSGGRR